MRLHVMVLLSCVAACNASDNRRDEDRFASLEKQNRGLEERITHLERDLAEARAIAVQETAARSAGDAKLTADVAALAGASTAAIGAVRVPPAGAPPPTPKAKPPSALDQGIR